MKIEEAKQIVRHVGRKNEDGSIASRPELDASGAPIGRGALTTDISVPKSTLFISIVAGAAIDQEKIKTLKEKAAEAVKIVDEAAKKPAAAKPEASK